MLIGAAPIVLSCAFASVSRSRRRLAKRAGFKSSPERRPVRAAFSEYVGPMPRPVVPILPLPFATSFARSSARCEGSVRCAQSEIIRFFGVTRIPCLRRPAISPASDTASMTTPLPMTHIFPGRKMPLGIRCSTYFFAATMTVCPALLPPCERTTRSAFSVRKSMILPLPSSPHWAPTRIVLAMCLVSVRCVSNPRTVLGAAESSESAMRRKRERWNE